jgi:geranylgeranyl diphosphate synthase type II
VIGVRPDLDRYLAALRVEIDQALERVLGSAGAPPALAEPLVYSLLGPGKRMRPCLTLAVAEAVGARLALDPRTARTLALPAACAVEMIHTYSLVHDDLPAMDNDDLRRGRPTTHVVYGDGFAILAGDGLLTDAFAVIADSPSPAVAAGAPEAPVERRLRAVATLARAAGSAGMVGGQAIDLAAVGRAASGGDALDPAALEDMHLRKTGALIRASATLGGILTGATPEMIDAVDAYARELGLAFQIVDDVLDVEGSAEALGKSAGKDAAAGKPTFPALYGLARSKQMAHDCVSRAEAALETQRLGGRLTELARWTLGRTS